MLDRDVATDRTIDLGGAAGKVLLCLIVIEVALFGLDYFIVHRELIDNRDLQNLVDITHEDTIGTWVSVAQYLMIAGIAWLIRLRVRDAGGSTWRAAGWGLLVAFFVYMSFDDGSRFHERVGTLFGDYARVLPGEVVATAARELLELFPSYNWQLAFFPVFAGMGLFLLVFLFRELDDLRLYALVLAGLSCWVLAVLLDFIEGSAEGMAFARSITDASYRDIEHMLRAVEETIELLGASLMAAAFLAHLTRTADGWTIRFVATGADAAEVPVRERIGAGEPVDADALSFDC